MKALRISNAGAAVEEVGVPSAPGEALVRVLRSGICNTDLELIKGYAGFTGTIGHEFVGVVERASGKPELEGTRVVGEINVGCGECDLCRSGDPRHCPNRTVLGIHGRDGAHAEYLQLPARNLIPVPAKVSDEEAVFVEPLAAAFGITERIGEPEGKLAVVGDGKLGILCARALALVTGWVTLIGKHEEKLRIAESSTIECVLLSDVDRSEKFETVVEASGSASGFETALEIVKPRGTIVLKSTFHAPLNLDSSRIVVDEISVVGSRCGRFTPALQLLDEERVRVSDLISAEFRLSDALEAIHRAGENGVLKVLIKP